MPVNVTGQRLHIIQNPRIVFWGDNKETFEGVRFKGILGNGIQVLEFHV